MASYLVDAASRNEARTMAVYAMIGKVRDAGSRVESRVDCLV